jgi:cytochrome b pre-mRNA-processing protein 3
MAAKARRALLLQKFFRPRPAKIAGEALYAAAVAQAREPALYTDLAVADTVTGRFELHNLHVVLLMRRLRGEGDEAAETSQALFDTYIGSLDATLREMGIGDQAIPKHMRKLGEALFGRTRAYDAALAEADDSAGLERLVSRTLYDEQADAPAARMAVYVRRQAASLAAQPLTDILAGRTAWAGVSA